jgi:hypothetical protein
MPSEQDFWIISSVIDKPYDLDMTSLPLADCIWMVHILTYHLYVLSTEIPEFGDGVWSVLGVRLQGLWLQLMCCALTNCSSSILEVQSISPESKCKYRRYLWIYIVIYVALP